MSRRDLLRALEQLAERYGLTYVKRHKTFLGLHRGLCVAASRRGGSIVLWFSSPQASIRQDVLEGFKEFHHCAEGGVPTAWFEFMREPVAGGATKVSWRGCALTLDGRRLAGIGVETALEIPDLVASDFEERGNPDRLQCADCGQREATNLAVIKGVHTPLCPTCWQECEFRGPERKSVLRRCLPLVAVGAVALLLVMSYWGSLAERSFERGVEAFEKQDYDRAIACFTEALGHNGRFQRAWCQRGFARLQKGQYEQAIADYIEAIRLDSKDASAYGGRGEVLRLKGDYDRAIADLSEAIRLDPEYAWAYASRGAAYLDNGEHDKALADLGEAIRLDPKYAWAYGSRGEVLRRKGDYDRAIAECTKAIELDPRLASAYYNRGIAYGEKGEHEKAVEDYTKAIELKPDLEVAYRARGNVYDEQGDYDRAMADLTKAIQLDPNDALAYGDRGIVYSDMREPDKAIADYTEAVRLDPRMAAAYALRAHEYCAKGDLDNAIADGTRAVELQPDNAEAYNTRGFAYYRKGDLDQAIADCTKAIELNHDFGPAYRNRGSAFGVKGLYDQAVADCGEAIRCDPSDAGAYYVRGNAYAETGRHDAAIKDYTEAIRLDPQYGWAWCNRGSVHLKKGDYDEALADYNEALRLDPQDAVALANRFVAATSARLKKQGGLPDIPRTETGPEEPGPKVPGTDRKEDGEQRSSRPSARRVAARAIVLAAIVYRSGLEGHASHPDAEPFRRRVLGWLDAVGLSSELEQGERGYLETPVGQAAPQTKINGHWRGQGLAVLAWALKRYELPPYDQYVDPLTAADGVGFLDANAASALLRSAVLRPSSDIDGYARHATIVHWRLRQFSISPGPIDFLEYLKKHPSYREVWLDGLRFVEGDLAIGEMGVAKVAGERFETCRSAALERQIAAYWLQGDHEVYSEVDSPTILMGL